MRISVVICTWNRAQSLALTLQTVAVALSRVRLPAEVVVVNNNCTDRTDSVIEEFATRIPLLRVFEPMQGLSHARNAAIGAATGDYIIWSDDDVSVDPDWLCHYADAFRSHPGACFFGGPIVPVFEGSPPSWLKEAWPHVKAAYATRDFGGIPFSFDGDRLPFGANFATRAAEQREMNFDPRFGRQPGDYWLVGEEREVLMSLISQGKTGWWVPGAMVQHRIPAERQTEAYIRQYYAGVGRSAMIQGATRSTRRFVDRPLNILHFWIKKEIQYRWFRATREATYWVPALAEKSRAWGWLQGAAQQQLQRLSSACFAKSKQRHSPSSR